MVDTSPATSQAYYDEVLAAVNYGTDGSYLSGITAYVDGNFTTQERNAYNYDGWRYCVYRGADLEKEGATDYINANAFALQDDDVVVWRYCSYSYVFPNTYAEYIANYFD